MNSEYFQHSELPLHAHVKQCRHWIFDMDGTLTLAQHDFDAIRAELGLPGTQPILEALSTLPTERAARLHQQLDAIELEIAATAQAASGAVILLKMLKQRNCKLGILTRNNAVNIEIY